MTKAEDTKKDITTNEALAKEVVEGAASEAKTDVKSDARNGQAPRGRFAGKKPFNKRRNNKKFEKRRSEFDQKILGIRRVTRVMAGGRRFSFSVAMALGDKKGRVGVGLGKAGDTALAIEKATRAAKKAMITLNLTDEMMLPHDVEAKYGASRVVIRPAKGRGMIAGASMRTVLELAGVKDVSAKLLSRSKNKINNARATIKALKDLA